MKAPDKLLLGSWAVARFVLGPLLLVFLSRPLGAVEEPASFNVGYRVFDFTYTAPKGEEKVLTAAVWYPTREKPRPYRYSWRVWGEVAPEADPDRKQGPYPLVVFSHGYGGCATSNVFFTEYLASQGFVVAAPDHADRDKIFRLSPRTRGQGGGRQGTWRQLVRAALELARSGTNFARAAFAYRPQDVSRVIDNLLRLNATPNSPLAGMIDPERIGVAGHSLGAYTSLAVSGMDEPNRDERIKAALLLSGGVFMWRKEEYQRLHLPVMFMFGELEITERFKRLTNDKLADTRRAYENCRPPKFMLLVKNATHFTFCQMVYFDYPARRDPNIAAEQVRVINTYGGAFLKRYLKGERSAEEQLQREDPMLVWYERDLGTEKAGSD